MKLYITLAFIAFIASSALAQQENQLLEVPPQGWYRQVSGTSTIVGYLFFLNRDTGWANANDGLYGTTNGGDTWTFLSSGIGEPFFIDAIHGIAEGDTSMVRTNDGGKNWYPIGLRKPIGGKAQYFGMDTIRIYDGKDSTALSNDGGVTWQASSVGAQLGGAMSFSDPKHGFICGRQFIWTRPDQYQGRWGADFETTTDGGKSWHLVFCPIREDLSSIHATTPTLLFVAGQKGDIINSINGGLNWDTLYFGNGLEFFQKIIFSTANKGYAIGYKGKIIASTYSYQSWEQQNSTVVADLQDIFFIDSLTGWACGNQGTILHTINGGKSWVHQYLPYDSIMVQTYPEPAGSKLIIHYWLSSPLHVTMNLYDASGKSIGTLFNNDFESGADQTHQFDISKLPNGSYFIELSSERYRASCKFTKIIP